VEERTSICVRQVLSEPLTRSVTGAVTGRDGLTIIVILYIFNIIDFLNNYLSLYILEPYIYYIKI
jgi:hypothetical protein